jgi:hypothetical protein
MRGANGDGDATDRWRGGGGCTMFEFAGVVLVPESVLLNTILSGIFIT